MDSPESMIENQNLENQEGEKQQQSVSSDEEITLDKTEQVSSTTIISTIDEKIIKDIESNDLNSNTVSNVDSGDSFDTSDNKLNEIVEMPPSTSQVDNKMDIDLSNISENTNETKEKEEPLKNSKEILVEDEDEEDGGTVLFSYEPQKNKYMSNSINNSSYKSILSQMAQFDFIEKEDEDEKDISNRPTSKSIPIKNTTSTTPTSTTPTSTTPRSSSFIAQPTIAILPELSLDDNNSNGNLSSGKSNSSNDLKSSEEPTTPTKSKDNNATNNAANNATNNANNSANKTNFFQRMFRRNDSKTSMSASPSKDDLTKLNGTGSNSTTGTQSSPSITGQQDNNFIVNTISNLSLSLPSLPSASKLLSNTQSSEKNNSNNNSNNNTNGNISHKHSNSSGGESSFSLDNSTNSTSSKKDMKDYSSLIEENEIYSYEHFLSKLDSAAHIKSSIDSFIRTLKNRKVSNDDLREALLDFVFNMQNSLQLDSQWESATEEELSFASNHLQQYVLEQIYDYIFQSDEESVKKDIQITKTIDKLHFITTEHLEVPYHSYSEEMWAEAGQYLLKINFTQSSRHKMMYITKSCKTILKYLGSGGEYAGADSLLPNLIYVVLKNNPPNLNSNVLFISKFSDNSDSEGLYYMTQLVSVIYFIENINAEMLKIDKKEFNKMMGNGFLSNSLSSSPRTPPRVSSPKHLLDNDNALANLVEMFPDFDTQYLLDCIKFIETKHKNTKISQPDLVLRVTNLIAEHQEHVYQSSNKLNNPPPINLNFNINSDTPTYNNNNSIEFNENTYISQSVLNDNDSLNNNNSNNSLYDQPPPPPYQYPTNNSLSQQQEQQYKDEINKLLQKSHKDQIEILELKKNLQNKDKEIKSLSTILNSVKIPTSLYQFNSTKIDELKITEVPMLLQEYKQLYNIIKITLDKNDYHYQTLQQQKR